jgi:hypothetical protein
MFSNDFKEKGMKKIALKETPVEPFLALLRYMYFGKLAINDYPEDNVIETLRLANYYQVKDLQSSIVLHLKFSLTVENVLHRLETALLLSLFELESICLRYIDLHANVMFRLPSFLEIHQVCEAHRGREFPIIVYLYCETSRTT